MQTALDKFSLRALVVLRLIAKFQQETRRTPTQYDLGTGVQFDYAFRNGIKSDPRALFEIEWQRLGIEAVYPRGFRHLIQFHLAVKALRKCGLMVGQENGRTAYALTEQGFALASQLTDDWTTWGNVDVFCEQNPRDVARRNSLTSMQLNVLRWACSFRSDWSYETMREHFPYSNHGTIRGLIDKGLLRKSGGDYIITQEGVNRVEKDARSRVRYKSDTLDTSQIQMEGDDGQKQRRG